MQIQSVCIQRQEVVTQEVLKAVKHHVQPCKCGLNKHWCFVQDNDGDWMLLGPEQPWPGKLDHVACRIVVSSA